MKVILVTPNYHQPRGNTITVERIAQGLNSHGITTEIISITEDSKFPRIPPADLVHGFNAYHFNKYWAQRGSLSYPYLITLTGTDLNHALFNEKTKESVLQTLEGSKAIHVFNENAKKMLWQKVPRLIDKTFLIPQGTKFFPLEQVDLQRNSFIFVLPAGIRSVKNIPAAISMLTSLYEKDPRIRLWIVGPIIEKEEGNKVRKLVEQNTHWISYWGEIPHSKMSEVYRHADVILNTSLSEGQSSAILEAMAIGIPVLVSDIAGNRDIVIHGKTGFLYSDEYEFAHYVQYLMENDGLRKRMGVMGKDYVRNHHSTEKEAQALRSVYHQILNLKSRANIGKKQLIGSESSIWEA